MAVVVPLDVALIDEFDVIVPVSVLDPVLVPVVTVVVDGLVPVLTVVVETGTTVDVMIDVVVDIIPVLVTPVTVEVTVVIGPGNTLTVTPFISIKVHPNKQYSKLTRLIGISVGMVQL